MPPFQRAREHGLSDSSKIRLVAAKVASIALALLPAHLDSAEKARKLLAVATGELPKHSSPMTEVAFDLQSTLFTLAYHIAGGVRRIVKNQFGRALEEQHPDVAYAVEALREALHRDLLKAQLEQGGGVGWVRKQIATGPPPAAQEDDDAAVATILDRLIYEDDKRARNRPEAKDSEHRRGLLNLRQTVSRSHASLSAQIGLVVESSVLAAVYRASAGIAVGLVRGPDFVRDDFALIPLDQDERKTTAEFPSGLALSNFQRLAWAQEHGGTTKAILCECKSGPPTPDWLQRNRAELFFIRPAHLPDRLFVVPKDRVRPLYLARMAGDGHHELVPSHPALAPYAISTSDLPELLERLVLGASEQTSVASHSALNTWSLDRTKLLKTLFEFRHDGHGGSFAAVWKLYEWLCTWQPQVEIDIIATQPLAGDFSITTDAGRFRVQHKVCPSMSALWLDGPSFFDYLICHIDDGNNGLLVWSRDGSEREMFHYDQNGAAKFIHYINMTGSSARFQSIVATAGLLHAELPEVGMEVESEIDWPAAPSMGAGLSRIVTDHERNTQQSRRLARHVYDYINRDPSNLDIGIACIYLDHDQCHPFGTAIVLRHDWQQGERELFRRSGIPPLSLAALHAAKVRKECVVLRFCCRSQERRNPATPSTPHFPLERLSADLPVTAQTFFLVCAPDISMPNRLPDTVMLFPSEFMNFPVSLRKIWKESDSLRQGRSPGKLRSVMVGHIQPEKRKFVPLVREGIPQNPFWISPQDVLRNLERALARPASMTIQHPEMTIDVGLEFNPVTYITDTEKIVRASLELGSVQGPSRGHARRTGYYGKLAQEKLDRGKRKAENDLEPGRPAKKGPNTG